MIPDRLPVELRNVAGVGTRTDVHNQSDPVLLDQREEHFQRMIGMADREDRSPLLGRLVFHLSRRVGEGKPGAGTPTMREKARLHRVRQGGKTPQNRTSSVTTGGLRAIWASPDPPRPRLPPSRHRPRRPSRRRPSPRPPRPPLRRPLLPLLPPRPRLRLLPTSGLRDRRLPRPLPPLPRHPRPPRPP